MSKRILQDYVISAREYSSLVLHREETLRVIDVEGKQVADLVGLSASDKSEKLSCVCSNVLNGTWKLTKGHVLFTNRASPFLSIAEDKVGLHYSGGGFCSEEVNYIRYKVHGNRNFADNLTITVWE